VVIDLSHPVTGPDDVGTRLVAPFHRDPSRADLAGVPLQRLVNVSILVVRVYAVGAVTPERFGDPGLLWGRAVLVYTGWAGRWRTAAYREPESPHLSTAAVDLLVAANVAIVGMDAGVTDDPVRPARPDPTALLGADIPILEHLTNLHLLPDSGGRLTALPPAIREAGTAAVRAVAVW
jgi:arylformamidase